jgi:hypothetical protein
MRRWRGPRLARAALLTWGAALFVVLIRSTRSLPDALTSNHSSSSSSSFLGASSSSSKNNGVLRVHADEIARLERSLDHGGKSALRTERSRVASAARKQMEDDALKQKNARTGEWRRLKRARNLTVAELDGYRRVADNEEVRLLRILAAQAPCGDKAVGLALPARGVSDWLHGRWTILAVIN